MTEAIHAVTMPTWGLSMQEGTLVSWLTEEGAQVVPGTELAEIETTKINNVLEATGEGILRRRLLAAGETRECGALIGILAGAGVSEEEIDRFIGGYAASGGTAAHKEKAPQPEMTRLADGRCLRSLTLGDGAGLPLVLIHGFGGDLEAWQRVQPKLALERRVWAFDLPGHGESSKTLREGSVAELAALLLEALTANGIGRAHLAGHSLGGAVALQLAQSAPERFASLALLAPAASGAAIDRVYLEGFLAGGRARDLQKSLARLFADPALASREMAEQVARNKRLDGAQEALERIAKACFGDAGPGPADKAGARAWPFPVCVIRGEMDTILPPADLSGPVALHLLPRVGHMPQIEAPDAVVTILAANMGAA